MGKREATISTDQAYEQMKRVCSRKECCVIDIRRKLESMGLPEGDLEIVIQRLKEERFIDEERFIRSFINDKLRFNKWGRKKIELSLIQKQLPREAIENAFSELPDTFLSSSLPALLEKKWRTITGKSLYEKEAKLIRYALGRGFTMQEINDCLRKINKKGDGDDE